MGVAQGPAEFLDIHLWTEPGKVDFCHPQRPQVFGECNMKAAGGRKDKASLPNGKLFVQYICQASLFVNSYCALSLVDPFINYRQLVFVGMGRGSRLPMSDGLIGGADHFQPWGRESHLYM